MLDWFQSFINAGIENKATEWQLIIDKPATLRIEGKIVPVDLTLSAEDFHSLMQEMLPPPQMKDYEKIKTEDFVSENFLFTHGVTRFLATLQRQRGDLSFLFRYPLRKASILFDILKDAVEKRASDIHLRENKYARYRLNATLVDTDFMTDTSFFKQAIEEITPPTKRESYEKTGDLDFAWEEEGIGRFRVNLHRQRGKNAFTFRHVKGKAPNAADVGLPTILNKIAESRNGIIFITGTTGSGKSTTMAALLSHINNTMDKHIITIEDPIEYTFQDNRSFFEQREVGLDAETFDSALIHALRQDPDIIMVGEMRNRTTFETTMTAAETGHMVITTLHTKSASQSIMRILDMYPPEERDSIRKALSECLQAIICQRLAPRASGKGVVPVLEILINTPIVKKLIFDNKIDKLPQAIEAGGEEGMMSFNKCLLELVNNGDLDEETALLFSDNPQALKMNLKGIFLSEGTGIIN